jgi:integrative and conjugative element protein (TIGR02256 family)
MLATPPTFDQQKAQAELEQLAEASGGLFSVDDQGCWNGSWLAEIIINCQGLRPAEGGLQLEPTERFTVSVPQDYPYAYPQIVVQHDRFAGQPHVQWGRYICLYAAANDWNSRRGMTGLVHQLAKWLEDAVLGRLEGAEAPWHAPVAYPSANTAVIVRADVPAEAEGADGPWVAWAVIERHADYHLEIRDWLDVSSAPGDLDGWILWIGRTLTAFRAIAITRPLFVAPMISLPASLGFEYPKELGDLFGKLEAYGLTQYDLLLTVSRAAECNKALAQVSGLEALPLLLLLGSPGRHEDISSRVAALAAWRVGKSTAEILDALARLPEVNFAHRESGLPPQLAAELRRWPVEWASVYDHRPQVTVRRDKGRPAVWLRGKRILLLGCGALGAPLAEHCVRAGCAYIQLVDTGGIHPGLLVRQPYRNGDIGLRKVNALADRLRSIGAVAAVVPDHTNALGRIPGTGSMPPDFDLIIDATASNLVAAKIERSRWRSRGFWPPVFTVVAGHEAERGIGVLSPSAATGAGVDILRAVLIQCGQEKRLQDFVDDFLPEERPIFVAEPGCSEPTYIGSSVDMSAMAALLLNGALAQLSRPASSVLGPAEKRSAQLVRNPAALSWSPQGRQMSWEQDVIAYDMESGYEIRIAAGAWEAMRRSANLANSMSSTGLQPETGGSLFGQIDPAAMVVWITEALGLPEGSTASPVEILLNTVTDREHNEELVRQSRGAISFIGLWHSHPNCAAEPSATDYETMRKLTDPRQPETIRPLLLLILGSGEGQWEDYLMYGMRPGLHAQIFPHA